MDGVCFVVDDLNVLGTHLNGNRLRVLCEKWLDTMGGLFQVVDEHDNVVVLDSENLFRFVRAANHWTVVSELGAGQILVESRSIAGKTRSWVVEPVTD